jgi:hypothetical protein
MPIPALRTKQSTSTTGTGTLTLNAAPSEARSFTAAFGGSSVKVRYILSRLGDSSFYEVGFGTFNGAAQLTRDTVVASSNGGSLVSIGAGDTDVFFDFLPGDRQIYSITGTTTLALADLGNAVICTPTADMTLNLPAIATVPPGMGFLIRNAGSNNAIIWIDPNASEGFDGSTSPFPLFGGESIEFVRVGTAWRCLFKPTGWRFFGRSSASASASVDFVLPQYLGAARSVYRVDFRQVRMGTDGAYLLLRTDDAGGASFDFGASDYIGAYGYLSGASAWSGLGVAGSGIQVSTDFDAGVAANNVTGHLELNPGAAGVRYPTVVGQSAASGNGASYAAHQGQVFSGIRDAAYDCNAIRFIGSAGTIALGDFDLFCLFD